MTLRNTLIRLVVVTLACGAFVCILNGVWTTRGFVGGVIGWCIIEIIRRVFFKRKR